MGETQDIHSRSKGRHKTYSQEVGGDTRRTLKKLGETQDIHSRSKGRHKTYSQEVGGDTRRTLKK